MSIANTYAAALQGRAPGRRPTAASRQGRRHVGAYVPPDVARQPPRTSRRSGRYQHASAHRAGYRDAVSLTRRGRQVDTGATLWRRLGQVDRKPYFASTTLTTTLHRCVPGRPYNVHVRYTVALTMQVPVGRENTAGRPLRTAITPPSRFCKKVRANYPTVVAPPPLRLFSGGGGCSELLNLRVKVPPAQIPVWRRSYIRQPTGVTLTAESPEVNDSGEDASPTDQPRRIATRRAVAACPLGCRALGRRSPPNRLRSPRRAIGRRPPCRRTTSGTSSQHAAPSPSSVTRPARNGARGARRTSRGTRAPRRKRSRAGAPLREVAAVHAFIVRTLEQREHSNTARGAA